MSTLLKAFVIGILMTLFGFYSMLVISTCWQQTPREGLPSLANPPVPPPPSVQYVLVEPSKCPPRVIEVKHFVIGGIDDLLNKTLHLAFITDGGSNLNSELKVFVFFLIVMFSLTVWRDERAPTLKSPLEPQSLVTLLVILSTMANPSSPVYYLRGLR